MSKGGSLCLLGCCFRRSRWSGWPCPTSASISPRPSAICWATLLWLTRQLWTIPSLKPWVNLWGCAFPPWGHQSILGADGIGHWFLLPMLPGYMRRWSQPVGQSNLQAHPATALLLAIVRAYWGSSPFLTFGWRLLKVAGQNSPLFHLWHQSELEGDFCDHSTPYCWIWSYRFLCLPWRSLSARPPTSCRWILLLLRF